MFGSVVACHLVLSCLVEADADIPINLADAITRIEADPDVWKQLNGLPEDLPLTISIDDSAVADLAAGFAVKRCDRQVRDRGDLWCDASSANDETASGQIDGRVVAPTSTPICAACDVPDSRLRRTAFMHPQVTGVRAFGGTHERSLNWAICDAGHQDRITGAPQLCIPESGHDCWFRDVTIGPRDPRVLLDPMTLPDTLDRLDDVWRLAFGSRVTKVASSLDIATLVLESGTREQFMDRIRALAEIFGALTIEDDLISAETPREYTQGSLNRLESALRARTRVNRGRGRNSKRRSGA